MSMADPCMQAESIGELKEGVKGLKEWQQRQNGSLVRLSDDVKSMKNWVMGLMGTCLISMVLLIANLVVKR